MAMEQLHAFRQGHPQDTLGPTQPMGPDTFPLLASSELRAEHEELNRLIPGIECQKFALEGPRHGFVGNLIDRAKSNADAVAFLGRSPDPAGLARLVLALLERNFAFDAKLTTLPGHGPLSGIFDYGGAAQLMALL